MSEFEPRYKTKVVRRRMNDGREMRLILLRFLLFEKRDRGRDVRRLS